MDLLSVLLCPKTEASCMFYRTKLQVHNFTLFCLDTAEGYCYVWDEVNGGLSSNVFAWLQYQHFKKYLENHNEVNTLIIGNKSETIIYFDTILLWIQYAVGNIISVSMDFMSLAMQDFNVSVLTLQARHFA